MTASSGSRRPRGPFSSRSGSGRGPYSVSALQNYAYCPYRFLLSALYHLQPLEEPEPLERMDPLTKGRLFHEVLAEFFRALQQRKMPMATDVRWTQVLEVLDATLTRVAANYAELLAPAVDRVWQDEIAGIRTDLHIWARELAASTGWEPWLFEFGFGLPDAPGRDPNSRREPVTIDGRFILRGAIDLDRAKARHEYSESHRPQNIEEPIGAWVDHRPWPATPAGDLQSGRRGGDRMHRRKRAFFILHDCGRVHRT